MNQHLPSDGLKRRLVALEMNDHMAFDGRSLASDTDVANLKAKQDRLVVSAASVHLGPLRKRERESDVRMQLRHGTLAKKALNADPGALSLLV